MSTIESFGLVSAQKRAELITLENEFLTVKITNYGARIVSIIKDGKDLVVGPKTLEGMVEDTCYCGAVCGRVSNRIKEGRFSLGEKEYQLPINNGPNHLHGGREGFDRKLWEIKKCVQENAVILSYLSADGEEGYPGELTIALKYSLWGNSLLLQVQAEVNKGLTPINITNHVYWNLSEDPTIDHHLIQCSASAYTPKDSTGIPDGRILPVTNSAFDLQTPVLLGERNSASYPEVADGFDHNFVLPSSPFFNTHYLSQQKLREGFPSLDNETDNYESGCLDLADNFDVPEFLKLSYVCALHAPDKKRSLYLSTSAPGLQIYTGEYLPQPRAGIALEAQNFPDAINHAHFPDCLISEETPYFSEILWTIC